MPDPGVNSVEESSPSSRETSALDGINVEASTAMPASNPMTTTTRVLDSEPTTIEPAKLSPEIVLPNMVTADADFTPNNLALSPENIERSNSISSEFQPLKSENNIETDMLLTTFSDPAQGPPISVSEGPPISDSEEPPIQVSPKEQPSVVPFNYEKREPAKNEDSPTLEVSEERPIRPFTFIIHSDNDGPFTSEDSPVQEGSDERSSTPVAPIPEVFDDGPKRPFNSIMFSENNKSIRTEIESQPITNQYQSQIWPIFCVYSNAAQIIYPCQALMRAIPMCPHANLNNEQQQLNNEVEITHDTQLSQYQSGVQVSPQSNTPKDASEASRKSEGQIAIHHDQIDPVFLPGSHLESKISNIPRQRLCPQIQEETWQFCG